MAQLFLEPDKSKRIVGVVHLAVVAGRADAGQLRVGVPVAVLRAAGQPWIGWGGVGGVTPCWQLPRALPAPLYLLAAPCNNTSAPCGGCWSASYPGLPPALRAPRVSVHTAGVRGAARPA
jgi:hypothetical protein